MLPGATVHAFRDELEKISYDYSPLYGESYESQLRDQMAKSREVLKRQEKKLQSMKDGPEKRRLQRQMQKRRKGVIAGHVALGASSAYAGYHLNELGEHAGNLWQERLGRQLHQQEKGLSTSLKEMKTLRDEIIPGGKMMWLKGMGVSSRIPDGSGGSMPTAFMVSGKSLRENAVPALKSQGAAGMLGVPGARTSPGGGLNAVPTRTWEAWSKGHGVSFAPEKAGPHIAAHELGHQANQANNPNLVKLRELQSRHSKPWNVASAIVPMTMATMAPSESWAAKLSPLVGGAMVAPQLLEEGLASVRGYQAMKRLGYNPQQLAQARSSLGKAWGTYAAPRLLAAAGAPALVVGGRRLLDRYRKKHGDDTYGDTLRKYRETKKELAQ